MLSPYEQGMRAYYAGDDKNPFKVYSQEYDDWAEGWCDASKHREPP